MTDHIPLSLIDEHEARSRVEAELQTERERTARLEAELANAAALIALRERKAQADDDYGFRDLAATDEMNTDREGSL